MKLEELARQSSAAARTSVSTLEPPPIGEPDRPRWLVPAVAGVAVTALVVGGLVVIDRNGGEDEVPAPAAIPVVAEPPRLALDEAAGDWTPLSAGPLDEFRVGPNPTFQYYGDAEAADPFAERDLLIGWVAEADDPTPTDGSPITVRGREGSISEGAQEFGFESTLISWREQAADGSLDVIVASRTIPRDDLLVIVDELTIDTTSASIAPADDLGLDLLTTSSDFPVAGLRGSGGWMATYFGNPDGVASEQPFLMLSSSVANLDDDRILMRWWSDEFHVVEIAGGEAYVADLTAEDGTNGTQRLVALAWSPEPGVVAHLRHIGRDDVDLVALAEQVVELNPAEWAELVEAVTPEFGDPDVDESIDGPSGPEPIADGGGEIDGESYDWTATVEFGDVLCVDVTVRTSSSGSCAPEMSVPPAGSAAVALSPQREPLLTVTLVADPAVDDLRPLDDRVAIERFEWNGSPWFVAIGPRGGTPDFEVIVDGEVVDTISVDVDRVEAPSAPVAPDGLAAEFPVLATAGHGDVVFVADGETDGLRWAIGESVAGLCLYTAGATDSLSCNEFGGIAVFPTVEVDAGTWTFVYSIHRDSCPIALDTGDQGRSAVRQISDRVSTVWIAEGEVDGWEFGLIGAGALDLPANGESIEWPDGTCEP